MLSAIQNEANIFKIQKLCMYIWIIQYHAYTINYYKAPPYLLAICDHVLVLEIWILIYKGYKRPCTTTVWNAQQNSSSPLDDKEGYLTQVFPLL